TPAGKLGVMNASGWVIESRMYCSADLPDSILAPSVPMCASDGPTSVVPSCSEGHELQPGLLPMVAWLKSCSPAAASPWPPPPPPVDEVACPPPQAARISDRINSDTSVNVRMFFVPLAR